MTTYFCGITGNAYSYAEIVEMVKDSPFCSSYAVYNEDFFFSSEGNLSVSDIAEAEGIEIEILDEE